jgi:hypothetical protein
VYPVYFKASITEGENWLDNDEEDSQEKTEAALRGLNEALREESTRQWDAKELEISEDPEAAHLQKSVDLPKSIAERAAKERRHRQFLNATPKTDKVQ